MLRRTTPHSDGPLVRALIAAAVVAASSGVASARGPAQEPAGPAAEPVAAESAAASAAPSTISGRRGARASQERFEVQVEGVEQEAPPERGPGRLRSSVDLFALEPFDAHVWQLRLENPDLEQRGQAFERFCERLPDWQEAKVWVAEQAAAPRGELAWTCRMLVRSLRAAESAAPRFQRLEIAFDRAEGGPGSSQRSSAMGVWSIGERSERDAPTRHLLLELDPLLFAGSRTRVQMDTGRSALILRGTLDLVPEPAGVAEIDIGFDVFDARSEASPRRSLLDVERAPREFGEAVLDFEQRSVGGAPTGTHRLVQLLPMGEAARVRDGAPGESVRSGVALDRLGVLVVDARRGLEVRGVEPGSFAEVIGLGAGDRLLAIDGVELEQPDQIPRLLERASRERRIALRWYSAATGAQIHRVCVVPGANAPVAPRASGDAPSSNAPSSDAPNGEVPSGDAPTQPATTPPGGGR